jgi:hypothetical protein
LYDKLFWSGTKGDKKMPPKAQKIKKGIGDKKKK